MMDEEKEKGGGLEWLKMVLQRRKLLAIAAFAVSLAALIGVTIFLPDIYSATATVLVDQDQVLGAFVKAPLSGEAEARQPTVETRLQTINQQILSRARLQEVVTRLNLYPGLRNRVPMEDIVEQLRRDIRLDLKNVEQEPGRKSTVAFAVSYRGRDPKTVALVANALASFFVDQNGKIRGQQATETAAFLKAQLDDMKKQLDEKEKRVSSLGRLGPGGAAEYLVPYERLGDQLRLNMDRLARLTERREMLAKQLLESDPAGDPRGKNEHLAKLRRDLNELRSRLTEKHPDVMAVQTEIAAIESGADVRSSVKTKTAGAADPSARLKNELNEVEAEIKSIKLEGTKLQGGIGEYQRKLESARSAERDSPQLVRDYDTTKELYVALLKKYAEAQQAESLERSQKGENFRVLDAAIPPSYPDAPNRSLLKLLSLVLSLGFAAAVVAFAEQLDTTFHTADNLRAFTRVPIVATIRRIVTDTDRERGRRLLRLRIGAAAVVLALMIGFSYYFAHNNEGIVNTLSRSSRSTETTARQ
jgi:polysaccharide chain length determinant protein (PEP-CTERM system associated)